MVRFASLVFTAAAVVGLAACQIGNPPASVSERCSDAAATTCDRFFECLSAEQRATLNLGATEAECVTQTEKGARCATATRSTFCPAGKTYDADAHEDCLDQIASATCDEIRIGGGAPACKLVCT